MTWKFSSEFELKSLWKKVMTIRTRLQFRLPLTLLSSDVYGPPVSVKVLTWFTMT